MTVIKYIDNKRNSIVILFFGVVRNIVGGWFVFVLMS